MTLQRSPHPSSLYDVLDLILDKGLVIDVYVRVSLLGIELVTVDARVVVASVDTYLRFAEAVNRLDLTENGPRGLPELAADATEKAVESGARTVARRKVDNVIEAAEEKLEGVADTIGDILGRGDDRRSD
jgi:hypothetical protein